MSAPRHTYWLLLITAGLLVSSLSAQPSDVTVPAKRSPAVELAEAFVARATATPLPEELNNPFSPAAFGKVPAPVPGLADAATAQPTGPSSDQELLELIAPSINPSGTMILGGRPLLLFGQKKVKEGDTLPITFQGAPYVLSIVRILPTSFTLRLNDVLVTRPIKSGN